MYEVKNFDNWIEDSQREKFGNGASEKIWLVNLETKQRGLFKFLKVKSDGTITGEYWAEKFAVEIGKLIGVCCADVDIGHINGRIGSMSYDFTEENDELYEGVFIIQEKYPYYNRNRLKDVYSNEEYCFQMIKNSIDKKFLPNVLQMIIFDALIGNSDRHPSNWAIIINNRTNPKFSPLYDNGSSLCAYEDPENTEIFFKDNMKYNALINTKSKSVIGWNNERPIRHFELLKHIQEEYYFETKDFIEKIENNISEKTIENILNCFNDKIISENMKKLLKKFVIDRKNIILDIYNMKDEV